MTERSVDPNSWNSFKERVALFCVLLHFYQKVFFYKFGLRGSYVMPLYPYLLSPSPCMGRWIFDSPITCAKKIDRVKHHFMCRCKRMGSLNLYRGCSKYPTLSWHATLAGNWASFQGHISLFTDSSNSELAHGVKLLNIPKWIEANLTFVERSVDLNGWNSFKVGLHYFLNFSNLAWEGQILCPLT